MIEQAKTHWFASLVTILIWLLIGWYLGLNGFVLVTTLTILEVTLSADNAIINSKVLVGLSRFWQQLFVTVGILIAVFIVRFLLPILIVAVTASLGLGEVLTLAVQDPHKYGEELERASIYINSFGGTFLFLVAFYFFADAKREHVKLWIKPVEEALKSLDQYKIAKNYFPLMFVFSLLVYAHNDIARLSILIAVALYFGLAFLTSLIERATKQKNVAQKTGWAAFVAFMYLQVLDASFSLDGVISAFAISSNIFIIMAGLGIGALWVRTLTIDMVKNKTLTHYRYLESGAHWAILLLSLLMFARLLHISFPDWLVGVVSLVCVLAAAYASRSHGTKPA